MKRAISYILFSLIYLTAARGQEVQVKADFDTSRILIGDQINYTITVDQPTGISITIPVLKDTLIKNIEILAGPFVDSIATGNGMLRVIEKYLVTSFDSGFYQTRPFYVEAKNPDGLKRFFSDPARLEVVKYSVAPADTSAVIYDIIKPYRAPVTLGEILPWILLLVIAVAIIWAVIRFVKKYRRKKEGTEIIINPDPAHVIAFRELEKLRDEELWQKGQLKQYYTRLTEILRQYLENRYGVYSLEMTTHETLIELLRTGFKKDEWYEKLRIVLTSADLVKFAKHTPDNGENESHFKSAWEFVQNTKKTVELSETESQGKEEVKQ